MKNQEEKNLVKDLKNQEKQKELTDLTAVQIEDKNSEKAKENQDRTKYGDWQVNGRTIDF